MKPSILTAVLCAFLLAGCGSDNGLPDAVRVSDRDIAGLKGPVKSVRHMTYATIDSAGIFIPGALVPDHLKRSLGLLAQNQTILFDPEGFITAVENHDGMEDHLRKVYSYEKGRRIVIERKECFDGKVGIDKTVYGRDNRIRKVTIQMPGVPFLRGVGRATHCKKDSLVKTHMKFSILFFTTMEADRLHNDTLTVKGTIYSRGKVKKDISTIFDSTGSPTGVVLQDNDISEGYVIVEHYRKYGEPDTYGNSTQRLIYITHDEDAQPGAAPEFITVRTIEYY